MAFTFFKPKNAGISLRVLARLLSYPDAETRANLGDMRAALHKEKSIPAKRLVELDALIDWLGKVDLLEAEARYVEVFDRGRSTSLHLFEHVHGDSRERGDAMVNLAQTYDQAGLNLAEGEMPDFLPAVLEFASILEAREMRSFLGEMAHIFNAIFNALEQRQSGYASVLGALIELAGEKAHPVKLAPEQHIDEAWAEPMPFDGCASSGQSKPNQPQPIHIVRKKPDSQGAIV